MQYRYKGKTYSNEYDLLKGFNPKAVKRYSKRYKGVACFIKTEVEGNKLQSPPLPAYLNSNVVMRGYAKHLFLSDLRNAGVEVETIN